MKRIQLLTPVLSGRWELFKNGKKVAEFKNIITNYALNSIGKDTGTYNFLEYCHVGTSAVAPAATQSALQAWTAQTNTLQGSIVTQAATVTDPVYRYTKTWRFGQGVAQGVLAEIGVGQAQIAGEYLWSRALILDAAGNPTTITVLADEYLDCRYTVEMQIPTTDEIGSITINGVVHNYTSRVALIGSWNVTSFIGGGYSNPFTLSSVAGFDGVMGAIDGQPSGNQGSFASPVDDAYVDASYQRFTSVTAGLNDANLAAGIKSMRYYWAKTVGSAIYQVQFDPVIPKNNTETLTLKFKLSWARV